MEAQIRRLAAAAEGLELQARELRAEIRELADSLSSQASAPAERPEPSPPARPPAPAVDEPSSSEKPSKPREGSEGARLVALSMALDGKSREETARHLRESFGLDDVDGLLADVYSRASA
jgi:hypothetical protein